MQILRFHVKTLSAVLALTPALSQREREPDENNASAAVVLWKAVRQRFALTSCTPWIILSAQVDSSDRHRYGQHLIIS